MTTQACGRGVLREAHRDPPLIRRQVATSYLITPRSPIALSPAVIACNVNCLLSQSEPPLASTEHLPICPSIMSGPDKDWKARCAARKQQQLDAIPKAWTIDPPPDERRNVLDVPTTCGLLTPRELQITDTVDVETLLEKLRTGQWTSVEVTTAFYKRAIIAQQLVCSPHLLPYSNDA